MTPQGHVFASFSGSVSTPGVLEPGIVEPGVVEEGGANFLASFSGTVSTEIPDQFDAPALFYGAVVKLAGQEIPAADLFGPIAYKASIDDFLQSASFGLVGKKYSVFVTTKTWTMKPVEIIFRQGPEGDVRERLLFAGFVRTCRQGGRFEADVIVECLDKGSAFTWVGTCLEIEPFAGLSRGQIVAELCGDAGITVDVPAGATYDKPVSAVNVKLFEFLREFGEPEGWHWRFDNVTGTLTAFVPQLKVAPLAADWEWTADDVESVEIEPPDGSPSRWLIRGFAAVVVDEHGVKSTTTVSEFHTVYAPHYAAFAQQLDGTLTDLFPSPELPSLRLTRRITSVRSERGGLLVNDYTRDEAWYNPRVGKMRAAGGGGLAPEGYHYTETLVDETGEYVQWSEEKFMTVGERTLLPTYEAGGKLVGQTTQTKRWYRKTCGVKEVGGGLNFLAYIGADEQSYRPIVVDTPRIEQYGLAQEDFETFTYSPTTGAVVREQIDTWTWYGPRCHTTGTSSARFVLYDGLGQTELVASYRLTTTTIKLQILRQEDRLLAGVLEVTSGYQWHKVATGAYDWGADKSNMQQEAFGVSEAKNVRYDILTEDSFSETTIGPDGKPNTRIIVGRLPIPRYTPSVWTRLVQQPIEFLLEDNQALAWFGPSKEVLQSDHIQTLAEAQGIVERRRARRLAKKVTVRRIETGAVEGDTIDVTWPPAGLAARGLLVSREISRDLSGPASIGTYLIEVPT